MQITFQLLICAFQRQVSLSLERLGAKSDNNYWS